MIQMRHQYHNENGVFDDPNDDASESVFNLDRDKYLTEFYKSLIKIEGKYFMYYIYI